MPKTIIEMRQCKRSTLLSLVSDGPFGPGMSQEAFAAPATNAISSTLPV